MIKHCRTCLMPSSRPRIRFDETGQCNACQFWEAEKSVDRSARTAEFERLLEQKRRHPVFDCIVPFSGGKDSASIAWRLREMGVKPLLVCYGQIMWTDVGRHNFDQVADAGFEIIKWHHDQDVSRKLTSRFFIERGHPKQHYDAGVNAVPLRIAVDMNIPLVIYAEHGESSYGGNVLSDDHRRRRDLSEVLENQVGDDPRNWAIDGISEKELFPYTYPDMQDVRRVGIEAVYFQWYFGWDIYENAKLARDKMDFRQAQNWPWSNEFQAPVADVSLGQQSWWGKSDGSFEGFDSIDDKIDDLDFYMMHIKFGFGRATRMASRLIQLGHMTREQGLELVRAYDGEFPESYLGDVLEYMGMTRAELVETVNLHRNPEIWSKDGDKWELRHHPV